MKDFTYYQCKSLVLRLELHSCRNKVKTLVTN